MEFLSNIAPIWIWLMLGVIPAITVVADFIGYVIKSTKQLVVADVGVATFIAALVVFTGPIGFALWVVLYVIEASFWNKVVYRAKQNEKGP